MFKKRYLSKIISSIMIAQLLVSSAFGSYMKIGTTSSDLTVNNGSTFLQKAYCTSNNNYYLNADADSSTVMRLSTVLRYISGVTTISTGNFTYTSFAGWTPKTNTPRLVTNADAGYESLESGYPYIKMENSTTASQYYLGAGLINFGNFYFVNNFGVTGSNLKFNYNTSNPTIDASTIVGIEGGSNTLSNPYNYLVDVKFIPEPCTPDTQAPVGSNYSLSGAIVQRAAIDSGVNFRISEPNGLAEAYAYVTGDAKQNTIDDPLNTGYIATGTYNQWGINTGSIRITLTYTGVARGTMDQRGTGIAITKVFSGSDLIFNYLTGGSNIPARTWNMNYVGAYVSVSGTVLTAMSDFRKETSARIVYSGADWANALPSVVNLSGTARYSANLFSYTYSFNTGAGNTPISHLYKVFAGTDAISVINSNTRTTLPSRQITFGQSKFYFVFTDNRAGIASGSIKVRIDVYHATGTVSDSYKSTAASADSGYLFSGSDLVLFASGGSADYPDYTGYVDFTSKLTLITGDRVRVGLYAEDFVGNSVVQTGSFDMQDYPPKPAPVTITIQVENHLAIPTTLLSGYYSSYQSTYGPLSGFLYNGSYNAELTGITLGSTLTGVLLQNGLLTGYANIDTGMDITKTFTFSVFAQNIYNQTGLVTLNFEVAPGCADAAGCGTRIMIYTGSTLVEAQANLTGTWYNGWFLKIKSSIRPTLTGDGLGGAVLYCAGGTNSLSISNLDGNSNSPYGDPQQFSGTTLYVSGDNAYGISGVIYLNGDIYIFRNLTGDIGYVTGKYVSGTQINWTRDVVTGTVVITGGYITGANASLFSVVVELGGGRRVYTYVPSDTTGFDVLIENRWNNYGPQYTGYYQTGLLRFDNSWIDRQAPIVTTPAPFKCQNDQTGAIALTSTATGRGENFTGNLTYSGNDDDVFIVTAFTSGADFTSYGDNQSSGAWIYDFTANSGYSHTSGNWAMTADIVFTGGRTGYIHFTDKAGNTGSILVNTTDVICASATAYAIPGYRDANNYTLTGTLSIYTLTGTEPVVGTLWSSYTGSLGTDGTGTFSLAAPLLGQTIGVVLQTSMHLPVLGFTGVFAGDTFFDFTIWTGLAAVNYSSGWFDKVDIPGLGLRSVLVPGDVYKSDNEGRTGSIINAFDMSVINANFTLGAGQTHPNYDFDNRDGIISSFEQAVIIQNLQREGRDQTLDGFEGLVYTGF